MLFHHQDAVERLEQCENELRDVIKELPAGWFSAEQVKGAFYHASAALVHMREAAQDVDKGIGEYERKVDAKYADALRRMDSLVNELQREIAGLKGTDARDVSARVRERMGLLADSLHLLILTVRRYPFHRIMTRKVARELLDDLKSGLLLVANLDFDEAAATIRNFLDEEFIAAFEYVTGERPLLFVTMDRQKRIHFTIVKHAIGAPKEQLVIKRIMSLLGLRAMEISQRHRMMGEERVDLQAISFIPGQKLISLGRFTSRDEILAFSFLLGAACADAFVMNLDDRPLNMHIDMHAFRKAVPRYRQMLLASNPIFQIDYEFDPSFDDEAFLRQQVFGHHGGLFIELFVTWIDMWNAGLRRDEVIGAFNDGIGMELAAIERNYLSRRAEIDDILQRSGLRLAERMSQKSMALFLRLERQYLEIPQFAEQVNMRHAR